jgi:hypothetical protein
MLASQIEVADYKTEAIEAAQRPLCIPWKDTRRLSRFFRPALAANDRESAKKNEAGRQ